MPTMTLEQPVPDQKQTPDVQSVKLKMDVIQSARIVSSCLGVTITDLLSDILRPIVVKMEREEMQKRLKASEPTRGPLPGQTSFIVPGKGRKGGAK